MKNVRIHLASISVFCFWVLMPQAQAKNVVKARLPIGVVAVVNGYPITRSEVEELRVAAKMPATKAVRDQIKYQIIVRRLIFVDADCKGYRNRPEIRKATENAEIQLYLDERLPPPVVSDPALQEAYEKLKSLQGKPVSYDEVKETLRKDLMDAAVLKRNREFIDDLARNATIVQEDE